METVDDNEGFVSFVVITYWLSRSGERITDVFLRELIVILTKDRMST